MNKTTAASMSGADCVSAMLIDYSIELNPKDPKSIDSAIKRLPAGTEVFLTWIGGDDPMIAVPPAAKLRDAGLCPVPHIGARHVESQEQLIRFASALALVGVDRVLVIGGDSFEPLGPFESSLAVLQSEILQNVGIKRIAIGGFPEGNPHVTNVDLIDLLAQKVQFGRLKGLQMSIVTQFAFEAAPVAEWLGRIRAAGIDVPVRLGIAGPAGIISLTRYALRCGVEKSLRALTENPAFAKLVVDKGPEPILQDLAVQINIQDKLPEGIAGVHFFAFGGFNKTVDWIESKITCARH